MYVKSNSILHYLKVLTILYQNLIYHIVVLTNKVNHHQFDCSIRYENRQSPPGSPHSVYCVIIYSVFSHAISTLSHLFSLVVRYFNNLSIIVLSVCVS